MVDNTQTPVDASPAYIQWLTQQAQQQNSAALVGGKSAAEDAAADSLKQQIAFSQPRTDYQEPSAAFTAINAAYQQQHYQVAGSGITQTPESHAAFIRQPGYVQNGGPSTGRAAVYDASWQPYVQSKYATELANQPSRSTVPVRDLSSGMNDVVFSSLPSSRETVTGYTPYGRYAQTELDKVKVGYGATGEVGFYQQAPGHSGYNLVSSGGRNALQSGMFTVNEPSTPVVYTQESAGTTFSKTANIPEALKVIASPDYYARLGAEVYGGFVKPLTGATVQSTGAQLSTYENPNNLANLVNPQAVNMGKAALPGENIPWSVPSSAPAIASFKTILLPTPFISVGKSNPPPASATTAIEEASSGTQPSEMPTIGGLFAATPIGKIINNWSWESRPVEESMGNIAADMSQNRGTEGLINSLTFLPFVGAETGGARAAIGAISPLGKGTIVASAGLGSSMFLGKVTEGPSQEVGASPTIDLAAVPVINFAAIPASFMGVNTKISSESEPGKFLSFGSGGLYKTADMVLGIVPGSPSITPTSLAITVPSKTPIQQFEVGAPVVSVSGGSKEISDLGNWLDANKGKVETQEQADYYNKYVAQYNTMAEANPTITTTTKNIVTIGSPDKVYKYGQWDIFAEKSGDVFRNLAGGYTPEQLTAYGETIKSKPGAQGLWENAAFGAGKFMSEKPLDVLPAIGAGTALYLGGAAIGAGLGMAAGGTGIVGGAARVLTIPGTGGLGGAAIRAVANYGVPLYFGALMAHGVTEGFTTTPQQTARNIGESAVPGVGMLWGAALPSILPSMRFGGVNRGSGGGGPSIGGEPTINPSGPSPIDTGHPMTPREYSLTSKLAEGEVGLPQFNKWMGIKTGGEVTVNTGMSARGGFLGEGAVPKSAVPTIGENLPTIGGNAKVISSNALDVLSMPQSAWQDLIVKNPAAIKSLGGEPLYNIAIARGQARIDYMHGTPDAYKSNYLYGTSTDYFRPQEFNFLKSGAYGKTVEAVGVGAARVQQFGGWGDYWTQVTPSGAPLPKSGNKMYLTFNSLDVFTPESGTKLTAELKSQGFAGAFKVPSAGIDAMGRYEHIVMYEAKPGDLTIGENIARSLWGNKVGVSFGVDTAGKSSTELKVEAMRKQLSGRAGANMISMNPVEGGFATTGKWGGMKLVPEQVWKPTVDYTNYPRGGGVGHFLDTTPAGWFKPAGRAAQIEMVRRIPHVPTDIERYAALETMMGGGIPLLETTKAVAVRSPWFATRPTVSSFEVLPGGVRVKQAVPSGRESELVFRPGTIIPNAPEAWTSLPNAKLEVARREAIRIEPYSGEVTVMGMRKEVRSPEGGKVFEGGRTQFNLFNLPGKVGVATNVNIKVPSASDILSVGFKKGPSESGAIRDVARPAIGSVYHYETTFADVSPLKVGVSKQTREVGRAISDILASKTPEVLKTQEYDTFAPRGKVAAKVNVAPAFDMGNAGISIPTATVKPSVREPVIGGMRALEMGPQIGKMDVATAQLQSMFGEFAPRSKPKVKSMEVKMAEAKAANVQTIARNQKMFEKLNGPSVLKSTLPNILINLPRMQIPKSAKTKAKETEEFKKKTVARNTQLFANIELNKGKTKTLYSQPFATAQEMTESRQRSNAMFEAARKGSVGVGRTISVGQLNIPSSDILTRSGVSPSKKEKQFVGMINLPTMGVRSTSKPEETNLSRILSDLKPDVSVAPRVETRVEPKKETTRLPYVDILTKTIIEPIVTPKTKVTVEPTYETKPVVNPKPPKVPVIGFPGMPSFGGGGPSSQPARGGKKFREILDYNYDVAGAARATSRLLKKGSNIGTGSKSLGSMGAPVKYKSAFNLPESATLPSSAPKKKGKK